jgi:HD-GYP domain-containing protein (c-di-GMP phosphodiesterase class II)
VESILSKGGENDQDLLKLSAKIDGFEGYHSPHGQRIAAIADVMATHFNLASRDRFFLQQAALIHDIGEMSMNRDYIRANRRLAENERLDLQRHPVIGEQEAAKLGLPRGTQLIIRWHHEWWNGSGYPDALETEEIPLAARILRVSDTYASMTAARPYRAAKTADEAKKYLIEWSGIEFDPTIVKAFLAAAEKAKAAPSQPVMQAQTA